MWWCDRAQGRAQVLVKVPSLLSCTEERMQERVDFLLTNCFNEEQLAKAAVAHPQVPPPPPPFKRTRSPLCSV